MFTFRAAQIAVLHTAVKLIYTFIGGIVNMSIYNTVVLKPALIDAESFKGIVYTKIKILSSITHTHVIQNLYNFCGTQNKIFWRMMATK